MPEEQDKGRNRGKFGSRLPKFLTEPISLSGVVSGEQASVSKNAASATLAVQDSSNENEPNSTMSVTNSEITGETVSGEAAEQALSEHDEQAALSAEEAQFQYFEYLVSEFQQMQSDMQRMYRLVEGISERETAQEKIFNTLHAELRDYKNDFIYEHLKPVVRPLLFLYDSLEQFDAEIALYERPSNGERRQVGLSPQLVRENISFFRDQLIEALRICEVTPMETPKGAFNPRVHKVIDVVPVDVKQDGQIQRVVRGGWYLNGQLLRSAEVIVGKKM